MPEMPSGRVVESAAHQPWRLDGIRQGHTSTSAKVQINIETAKRGRWVGLRWELPPRLLIFSLHFNFSPLFFG